MLSDKSSQDMQPHHGRDSLKDTVVCCAAIQDGEVSPKAICTRLASHLSLHALAEIMPAPAEQVRERMEQIVHCLGGTLRASTLGAPCIIVADSVMKPQYQVGQRHLLPREVLVCMPEYTDVACRHLRDMRVMLAAGCCAAGAPGGHCEAKLAASMPRQQWSGKFEAPCCPV